MVYSNYPYLPNSKVLVKFEYLEYLLKDIFKVE